LERRSITDARRRHLLIDGQLARDGRFWIEEISEPELTEEQKAKFPEK
jgi:hypothetical protein